MNTMLIRRLTVAALAVCMALPAHAQGPATSVTRILVGFPPGQATDLVARLLAERLTTTLARPVIVENKPGQGGSIALATLAKSPPDGNTLTLSALAAYAVNPYLYPNVGYSTLKDLAPVAMVADLPLVLAVNPSVPATTLKELVAYAKANPDKLSHSSSGNGTLSHLLMEDFKQRAGIKIMHVPYPGSARAVNDLIAGTVQVGLDTVAVLQPQINAGKLRIIAAGTRTRLAAFPDTPTFDELGYPGFEAVAWVGVTAPAGTPLALREQLNAEIQKIVRSPDFTQRLLAMGSVPRPGSIDEMAALLKSEDARWQAIIARSGAKVD
jgi:tripartite-type tricarboxylate transporter receptor subunit TctC